MKPNVIILTGGLSGSSVLAGLIARAGYWLGNETKKVAYDTFENDRLVDLDMEILRTAGYLWEDTADIPPPSIERIEEDAVKTDLTPFREFISECDAHKPWLWKDPRLCYTIFFWKKLIDLQSSRFILIKRDLKQTWTGMILRGKMPIPYDKLRVIQDNCVASSEKFLRQGAVNCHTLTFEELLLNPAQEIERINRYLDIALDVADLEAIYNGTLHKKRWTGFDFVKAHLNFLGHKFLLKRTIQFPRMSSSTQ